jgi:multicomponent Na+:H+ antiporter subunit F
MNMWLIAGCLVCAGLLPCAAMCLRGSPERRLVGMEMAGILIALSMALLAIGFGRPLLIDMALALAIMSFGGSLVYVRFLEKHL